MSFSLQDRILIKKLYFAKAYGAVRLINEFPAKGWKKSTLNDFVKRLKQTGSITRSWVAAGANIDAVDELVLSLKQSDSGDASVQNDIILNICCKMDA